MRTLPATAALALMLPMAGAAMAQDPTAAPKEALSSGRKLVVVPIPVSNPALGNGLAITALALYRPGGSERPWSSGLGGVYTDTSSWAALAFQKAYIADDRFRVTAAAGGGVFNLDFYGIGQNAGSRGRSIPIEQKAIGGMVEGLVRVRPNFYAGLQYRAADIKTSLKLSAPLFPNLPLPKPELDSRTSALGVVAEYDTRDNEYQPRMGLHGRGVWLRNGEELGSDFDYGRLELELNGYRAMGEKTTFAWRVSTCWRGEGAPFFDLCNYGAQNDLRGYPNGQYRDQAMYAVQAELRRKLFWRVGAVGFAGVGSVAPSFEKLSTDEMLPAAGVGLRFAASREYGVNASIDYAWGKDGSAVYFYVGEAF